MSTKDKRARMRRRIERKKRRRESPKPHYKLDLDKARPEHAVVAETIESLIDRNKFLPTAVRGILLVADLNQGHVEKLLEYYPWIVDNIKASLPPPDTSALERKIEQLQDLILKGGSMPLVASGPKPLSTFKPLPMPAPDDEDTLVLKRDTSSGQEAGQNFYRSMMALEAATSTAAAPDSSRRTFKH